MTTPLHRQEEILKLLDESSYAAVDELARMLECSKMTIRRDVVSLLSVMP